MRLRLVLLLASLAAVMSFPFVAYCCPGCTQISATFCEEIAQSDVAVIAKLIEVPQSSDDPTQNITATVLPAKFEIVEVLKGEELVEPKQRFETLHLGSGAIGKEFLVYAMNDVSKLAWTTPIAITPAVKPYLQTALTLPKDGPDRLAFFQDYLEGSDEMLARDAYDEFARAPYKDVVGLKDHMKHDQVVEWIKNPKIPFSHHGLYLTMLGICGNAQDIEMLEQMIKDKNQAPKPGMSALVATYLTLKGEEGLPLIEDLYFKDDDAEYVETYAAIMALRILEQENTTIPKKRLVQSLRLILDRPNLADQVVPDLARWEDWDSMEKMVQLFKEDDEGGWMRIPVINYLRACPLPEAKKYLEELAELDPETFKRAETFYIPTRGTAPVPTTKTEKKDASDGSQASTTESSADDIPDASKFVDPEESSATTTRQPEAEKKLAARPTSKRQRIEAAAILSPKIAGSGNKPIASNRAVLGGLALAGLALFSLMVFIIRGGQHVTSS